MAPSADIARLIEIMAALRDPVSGCPWDKEQTFATIAPYTIEEAYEVADAIQRGDLTALEDELGDLLLQVAYHARLAEEVGAFAFGDVVMAITAKMIRRHPHVFGEKAQRGGRGPSWDAMKAEERKAAGAAPAGVLAGVPMALPGLTRAVKLQRLAGKVGFDWNDPRAVIAKIREEVTEAEAELVTGSRERLGEEIGDILFAVANLARHLEVDPEAALRSANAKFERRFAHIERALAAQGRSPGESDLAEMEALWQAAKANEAG
ncbi:MAG: nucleoside triphosphate pyrophosphohydrolase [Bauldia sp.]